MTQALESYREKAAARGLPDSVAAWWTGLARPSAELCPDGDGPVVGRFGGRPELPPDTAWPCGCHESHPLPFFASVDLAALPDGCLDLDLPADGRLLFFADPFFSQQGAVVHVSAAGQHEAQAGSEDELPELCAAFPMRFRPHWTLPQESAEIDGIDGGQWEKYVEQYDLESAHGDIGAWHTWSGGLVLGGYTEVYPGFDSPAEAGRTLLAQVSTDEILRQEEDYDGFHGMVWWTIPTEDLAARRFDRVSIGSVVDPP